MSKLGVVWWVVPFLLALSGCTKRIDYQEEAILDGAGKVEIVKRRNVYEYVFHQYRFTWWPVRSEIYLFDKSRPSRSEDLKPLYLERLPDKQGYLLVAGIENAAVCYQRGRPTSYYVAFHIKADGTTEVPLPLRLDSVPTNLLLTGILDIKPANGEVFTLPEKAKLARLYGVAERKRKIILSSKFGC